jgi:hypothetical protein
LNSSFNTSYKYIGITFKKIIGNAAASSILGIRELELYGNKATLWFKLKKSNVHVPVNGLVTYRMIFKNR